jgi:hypothetical protein
VDRLNHVHYDGAPVFSNEGLKVCFDRNSVPRQYLTKTENGSLVIDERPQAPTQMTMVLKYIVFFIPLLTFSLYFCSNLMVERIKPG